MIGLHAMAQQIGGSIGEVVILLLIAVISLAFVIILLVALWRIFAKASQPGWAALIPIYNTVILLKIVGRPLWWLLLLFVPVVNFVIYLILMHDLSRAFGKDIGFTLGLIFLSPIFVLILAFGPAQYVGARGDEVAVAQPDTEAGKLALTQPDAGAGDSALTQPDVEAGDSASVQPDAESGGSPPTKSDAKADDLAPAEPDAKPAESARQGPPIKIVVAALSGLLLCGMLAGGVYLLNEYRSNDIDPETVENMGEIGSEETSTQKGTIAVGNTVSGMVTTSSEVHDWTFEGQAGQMVTLRCNPAAGESTDPVITLLGPDGASLAEDDDSGDGFGALIDNVVLPADGMYTIRVEIWLASTGSYELIFE